MSLLGAAKAAIATTAASHPMACCLVVLAIRNAKFRTRKMPSIPKKSG